MTHFYTGHPAPTLLKRLLSTECLVLISLCAGIAETTRFSSIRDVASVAALSAAYTLARGYGKMNRGSLKHRGVYCTEFYATLAAVLVDVLFGGAHAAALASGNAAAYFFSRAMVKWAPANPTRTTVSVL